MQRDEQVSSNLDLDEAISLAGFMDRRNAVIKLLMNGAQVTPAFLEKAIATYDDMIIKPAIEAAIRSGVKPTAASLHIAIDRRAEVTKSSGYNTRAAYLIMNLYDIQTATVKNLIKAGAEVTPEILDKAVADEKTVVNLHGENLIVKFCSDGVRERTSVIIKAELKKIAEVRINAQVLAQAYRTGTGPGTVFFGGAQIPPEILAKIALLMGDNPDVIEDDQKAYKIARDIFRS